MAYRRRRTYARKRVQKSSGGSTLGTIARVANTALKIGKFVASVVNVEKKFYDVGDADTANTTGQVDWLTGVTIGTSSQTRIGQSVKMTSLKIKGFVDVNSSSSNNQTVRIMVVQDNLNYAGGAPTPAQILSTTGSANIVVAPMNMDYPSRFHVFYDKTFDLSPIGTGSGRRSFTCLIKPKENPKRKETAHLKWDSSGEANTDAREGQIYLFVMSDQSSNTPTVRYISRLRFIDN